MKAFDEAGIKQPFIAGLAKREETIVLDDFTENFFRAATKDFGFCNAFVTKRTGLQTLSARRSILKNPRKHFRRFSWARRKAEEFPIEAFWLHSKIKSASVEQLRQVDGIGLETAAALREFLDANFPPENNA